MSLSLPWCPHQHHLSRSRRVTPNLPSGILFPFFHMDSLQQCMNVLRILALKSADPNSYVLAEREIGGICKVRAAHWKS